MRSLAATTFSLIALLTLAGCGQTGPLYLPDKAPQQQAEKRANPEVNAEPGAADKASENKASE